MLNSFIFLFLFLFALSTAALPFLGFTHFMAIAMALNLLITSAMLATLITYWISQRAGDFIGQSKSAVGVLYTTVTFLALATGLCAHCSRAVLQGLFGQATPFVRTPKLNVTDENRQIKGKQAYNITAIPPVVFIELALTLLFIGLIIISFGHQASVFIGIYIFYAIAFGIVSVLSVREVIAG
jgi:hypothetical protein